MERIASFSVDHTKLQRGMYVSRVDGDVITYDIRTRRPNVEPVPETAPIHTIEHLFATYVRNSEFASSIVYFGPMGCRTGYYFLTRDTLPQADAIALTVRAFRFIRDFEGEIPGARPEECGNYRDHSLTAAKLEAEAFLPVIEGWTVDKLKY